MALDRPGAAANDCTAALALNPDSGKAYKLRAKAYLKLEKLEEAHADFSTGLKIDYYEDTEDAAKAVAEKVKAMNAKKVKERNDAEAAEAHRVLMENKRKYEEGMKEREGELRQQCMD